MNTTSSRPVRLGIIGLGAQGGMYAKLIGDGRIPQLSLGAICDVDTAKSAVAERYGVPFFDEHLAMLDSGTVDAIVTTVPHYLHPEMGIAALQRGVHARREAGRRVHRTGRRTDPVRGHDP